MHVPVNSEKNKKRGDKMDQKYNDLYQLIQQDQQANQYYSSLPEYVKDMMSARSDSINSYESLCDYAENLTRGDN